MTSPWTTYEPSPPFLTWRNVSKLGDPVSKWLNFPRALTLTDLAKRPKWLNFPKEPVLSNTELSQPSRTFPRTFPKFPQVREGGVRTFPRMVELSQRPGEWGETHPPPKGGVSPHPKKPKSKNLEQRNRPERHKTMTNRHDHSRRRQTPGPPSRIGDDGSLRLCIDGHEYPAHDLAWLWVHGRWPDGKLEHINGDPTDNRLANLREAAP